MEYIGQRDAHKETLSLALANRAISEAREMTGEDAKRFSVVASPQVFDSLRNLVLGLLAPCVVINPAKFEGLIDKPGEILRVLDRKSNEPLASLVEHVGPSEAALSLLRSMAEAEFEWNPFERVGSWKEVVGMPKGILHIETPKGVFAIVNLGNY